MIPSIGRIVHYVLSAHDINKGEHRPAIIVKIFDETPTEQSSVNLQVFTDASNDGMANVVWRTSVSQDPTGKALGSWHAPEVVPAPAAASPS